MKENIALEKSEDFAIRIMNIYAKLRQDKVPYVLLEQMLRSATSIGANLSEGICAVSAKDFLNKVYISLKECSETKYWLRLLNKGGYLDPETYNLLYEQANEIFRILTATTKTLSNKLKPEERYIF